MVTDEQKARGTAIYWENQARFANSPPRFIPPGAKRETIRDDERLLLGQVSEETNADYLAIRMRHVGFLHVRDIECGSPDFRIADTWVELKTNVRSVRPEPHYHACYPAGYEKHTKAAWLLFASYELRRVENDYTWLVGGMERDEFFKVARFVPRGQIINERGGQAPFIADNDVWALEIRELVDAKKTLRTLEGF